MSCAILSLSDTARAITAAEAFLGSKLGDYEEPAGSDEYDSWEGSSLGIDDESELGTVSNDKILVDCTVSVEPGCDTFFVVVTLDREFKALSHDLDDAINGACADAAADDYTRRAEGGFRDA